MLFRSPTEESESSSHNDPVLSNFDSLRPLEYNPLLSLSGLVEGNKFKDIKDVQNPDWDHNDHMLSGHETFDSSSDKPPAITDVATVDEVPPTHIESSNSSLIQNNLFQTLADDTSVQPGAVSEDPFAAFQSVLLPEATNRVLPPLSSYIPNSEIVGTDDDDDFGDFDTPVGGSTPAEVINEVYAPMFGEEVGGESDSFGDFETPAGSASPVGFDTSSDMAGFEAAFTEQATRISEGQTKPGDDHNFDDIAVAGRIQPAEVTALSDTSGRQFDWSSPASITAPSNTLMTNSVGESFADDFGDFANFSTPPHVLLSQPLTQVLFPAIDKPQQPVVNEILDFASFDDTVSPVEPEFDGADTFTAFNHAPTPNPVLNATFDSSMTAKSEKDTEVDEFSVPNAAFAAFESVDFEIAAPSTAFAAFESATAAPFASFDNVPIAPSDVPTFHPSERRFDGDWSAFDNASANTDVSAPSTESLKEIREEVKSLANSLPETIRQRNDGKGQINFFKAFELGMKGHTRNFSWEKSMDVSKLYAAKRCVELMRVLCMPHSKSVTYWVQSITKMHDEITMGLILLEESKGLPPHDRIPVDKALSIMLLGFGEYIRVLRSIVATIGDLMCLDPLTEFSRKNVTTIWGGLALLHQVLEVETAWAKTQHVSRDLGLSSVLIDSVMEIRRMRLNSGALCGLTLQRLSDSSETTKARVEWGGQVFMACSANFWSNMVSPTVPYLSSP